MAPYTSKALHFARCALLALLAVSLLSACGDDATDPDLLDRDGPERPRVGDTGNVAPSTSDGVGDTFSDSNGASPDETTDVTDGGSLPSDDEPSGTDPNASNASSSGEEPSDNETSGGEPSGGEPSGGEPSGGEPSGGEPSGGEPSGDPTTPPVHTPLDSRLETPPESNPTCTTPGSMGECATQEVCRHFSAEESRCETCSPCRLLGGLCQESSQCDILFTCFQGRCTAACDLSTPQTCGVPTDCLDIGHPTHGICRP